MVEAERLRFPPAPSRDAGWFADWVRDGLGDRAPATADLLLRTTLDTRLQAAVEARLEALLAGPGRAAGVSQGAVVAIDAATGAVRAMAGGRDYRASPFNRATQARRQPGSAFKPFVYLAALEAGARPEDMVADGPITLGGWSPGNGNWRARGEISIEDALAFSVNTAAVRVHAARRRSARGAPRWRSGWGCRGRSRAMPRSRWARRRSRCSTWSWPMRPSPMAGSAWPPFGIAEARAEGRPIAWLPPARAPVIAPETAEAMRRMMAATVSRGTGRAAAVAGPARSRARPARRRTIATPGSSASRGGW